MKYDPTLPSLAELLAVTCHAEVARRIGKPRGFVWRLAHGGPLLDSAVFPALAKTLHQPEDYVLKIAANDARRAREEKSA